MPISFGVPGFELPLHDRIAALVGMVGGVGKAAALTGKSRGHIENMRKAGAPLRLDDCLVLAQEAGVTLDWVATGYQVRLDLAAAGATVKELADRAVPGFEGLPGFTRLLPVKPQVVQKSGASVERWTPSEIAVSSSWLDGRGLTSETARYAILEDDGMAPQLDRGALVVVDTRPAKLKTGIYLVEVGDELLARRYHPMPAGNAELVPDVAARSRYSISGDRPDGLGLHRVVWAGRDY